MSDGLHIPEHLWKVLELMEQEMGVPKNNLVSQAVFTFARLNGYVVAGQVPLSRAASGPLPSTSFGREEASPPQKPLETPRAFEAPKAYEPPPGRAENFELPASPSQDTSPRYTPVQEVPGRRRSPISSPLLQQAAFEEEAPLPPEEELHLPEMEEEASYSEPEMAPPMLYLEIPGEEAVPMEADEFIIGRGKSCHFVIDSNRVSRQHARIIREGNNFILEDLNSSNGTFYGKHREKVTRRKIVDGDEFIFGTERVAFFFQ